MSMTKTETITDAVGHTDMKTLLNYTVGFTMGALFMFVYLMGHMLHHDAIYHDANSKFGQVGVMPIYQPAQNVVKEQVETNKRK